MQLLNTVVLRLLFVLMLTLVASKDSKMKTHEPKPASTPEEIIKEFSDAVNAGDTRQIVGLMTKDAQRTMKQLIAAVEATAIAQKEWHDALDEKFGKDNWADPSNRISVKSVLVASFGKLEILDKKIIGEDKVELKVKTIDASDGTEFTTSDNQKVTVVREAGKWKIAFAEFIGEAEKHKKGLRLMEVFKDALQEQAKNVRSGKFKTRSEANKAFLEALRKGHEEKPKGKQKK